MCTKFEMMCKNFTFKHINHKSNDIITFHKEKKGNHNLSLRDNNIINDILFIMKFLQYQNYVYIGYASLMTSMFMYPAQALIQHSTIGGSPLFAQLVSLHPTIEYKSCSSNNNCISGTLSPRKKKLTMLSSFMSPSRRNSISLCEHGKVTDINLKEKSKNSNKLDTILSSLTSAFPLFVLSSALLGVFAPSTLSWVSGSSQLIPLMLSTVMLGTGMTLEKKDFTNVLSKNLVSVPLGILCQFLIMPLSAYLVGHLVFLRNKSLSSSIDLYLGLILVGCSPGGTSSNLVSLIAGADLALSVLLTACSTIMASFVTPALVQILLKKSLTTSVTTATKVQVSGIALCAATAKVVLVPVLLGMLLNNYFPNYSKSISRFTPFASVLLVALICGGVVAQNFAHTALSLSSVTTNAITTTTNTNVIPSILKAVFLLHSIGFAAGYIIPRTILLDRKNKHKNSKKIKKTEQDWERTSRTISIETGMQNSALAVVLARSIGANHLASLPGALSATTHSCLGSLLAAFWRFKDQRMKKSSLKEHRKKNDYFAATELKIESSTTPNNDVETSGPPNTSTELSATIGTNKSLTSSELYASTITSSVEELSSMDDLTSELLSSNDEKEEIDQVPLEEIGEWAAYLDENGSGLIYYFNSRTGESTWETPNDEFRVKNKDKRSPNGKVVKKILGASSLKRFFANRTLKDKRTGRETYSSNYVSIQKEKEPQPLQKIGDWAAYADEKNRGCIYYFNTITGESTWEPPTSEFTVSNIDTRNGIRRKVSRLTGRFFTNGNKNVVDNTNDSGIIDMNKAISITTEKKNELTSEMEDTESTITMAPIQLNLDSASKILPHPDKIEWGGEDAVFLEGRTFGIFDGVSGADKADGVPLYSMTLAEQMQLYLSQEYHANEPKNRRGGNIHGKGLTMSKLSSYLEKAIDYADEYATGASTAIVASLGEDNYLRVLNVGDSALIVIRGSNVVSRSKDIVHFFNCPYQFALYSPDSPSDGTKMNVEVVPGDIIVMASDGIFDNLDNQAIIDAVQKDSRDASNMVKNIIEEARRVSLDCEAETPFGVEEKKYFGEESIVLGGKVDDISCIVFRIY